LKITTTTKKKDPFSARDYDRNLLFWDSTASGAL